ncbi:hypothetical protein IKO50_00840 [bacterium]|nr:hypothetical protein [bacterium]
MSALIPAGISIGNKVINGRTYNNRATNGYSPETCGNYDHKKTLVCNNGTMYLVKND